MDNYPKFNPKVKVFKKFRFEWNQIRKTARMKVLWGKKNPYSTSTALAPVLPLTFTPGFQLSL
jgi:hypothetical protein